MADNKDQSNNTGNQYNNYQPQQPPIQGYQPYNQTINCILIKQDGMYRAHDFDNDYYNSFQKPVEHQHYHPVISPSPILSEKGQSFIYKFLWGIMIWEGFGFGVYLFCYLLFIYTVDFNFATIISIAQIFAHLLASIFCKNLIRGFKEKDERPFNQGKKSFMGLFIFECLYVLVWIFESLKFKKSLDPLFYLLLFSIIPALAFVYILWSCSQLEKLFGSRPHVCESTSVESTSVEPTKIY